MEYLNSIQLKDEELTLVFAGKRQATEPDGSVSAYYFDMINSETGEKMGFINVKEGHTDNIIQYRGNIGYEVFEKFRGEKYALRSCQLLKDVIDWLGLSPVYITCSLNNKASIKVIEALGARFLETVIVNQDSPYYQYYSVNDRIKLRYIWEK